MSDYSALGKRVKLIHFNHSDGHICGAYVELEDGGRVVFPRALTFHYVPPSGRLERIEARLARLESLERSAAERDDFR